MAYTLATTSLVRVEVDGLPSWILEAWELVPSFVSLKDIAGGLQLEAVIEKWLNILTCDTCYSR
ncbi:unnamed protein product [Prunus armeniaca]